MSFLCLKQSDKWCIKENLQSHIISLYRFLQIAILYFYYEINLRLRELVGGRGRPRTDHRQARHSGKRCSDRALVRRQRGRFPDGEV